MQRLRSCRKGASLTLKGPPSIYHTLFLYRSEKKVWQEVSDELISALWRCRDLLMAAIFFALILAPSLCCFKGENFTWRYSPLNRTLFFFLVSAGSEAQKGTEVSTADFKLCRTPRTQYAQNTVLCVSPYIRCLDYCSTTLTSNGQTG